MHQPSGLSQPVRSAIEIAVYLLLIFALVAWCLQIISPFVSFVTWGAVIAVAVYPAFLKLRAALGGRNKMAVVVSVALGLVLVIGPAVMFAGSLVDSVQQLRSSFETGQFDIPAPSESVRDWPLVGDLLYANWAQAADNFGAWLGDHHEQVGPVLGGALAKMGGIGLSVLQFLAATLVAAAMLAHDESTRALVLRFARRLAGDRAEEMVRLSAATVRSVAVGVLGIAFIQAVAGGAGMMLVGVPAAGIWALFILVLAIAQLSPLLVLLPAVVYVFSTNDSTVVAVLFTGWSIVVSFADAVLKPLLLGRGVEAPMLVILLGAIGGLLMSGIIGLFLGAVVLTLGYKLFESWMAAGERPNAQVQQPPG